ncbi:hypothetical protein KP014_21195 [Paenibacillus sophorae]|uniref:Uncharacterized protein n=1 Tax=Paenibacillus sophorae TaxID=1333845 RepID=A0ABX8HJN5_9BACL|nr:hypothetical protein KP014_21195 [Paenibacillus sophorae]
MKCLNCGKYKAVISFYMNTNHLFSSDKFEVCKDCLKNSIGAKDSDGYLDRVMQVLATMDKPFLQNIWESSNEDWSKYIIQISSLSQHKGKKFSDSIIRQSNSISYEYLDQINEEFELTQEEISQLQLKWGKKGFDVEDYIFLENEYHTWINSYECDSYAMEMLFQEISHKRLEIKKLRESGKSTDKEMKTLQDLLGSSNIKPVQETGANATEQATFGTLIKKYENERPIPEPDPVWKDVDGIKKYIQVWFFGHLCKMLGINNDYSQMYEDELKKYTVDTPDFTSENEDGSL